MKKISIMTAVAAAAVSLAVGVPSAAHAAVSAVSVKDFKAESKATTGCRYTVVAKTNTSSPVTFYDNDKKFASGPVKGGTAEVSWSPTTTGDHVLKAGQPAAGFPFVRVQAVQGIDLGSMCFGI